MKNIIVIAFCLSVNILNAQNLVPLQGKKGLFGYKKTDSKRWVIKPTFQELKRFGEMGLDSSLAFAKQNNLWGVIDQKGKWTLEPRYDSMNVHRDFKIIKAYQKMGSELYDLLDTKSNIKIEQILYISQINKNFVTVFKNGKENLFKVVNGELIITPIQDCDRIIVRNFDGKNIIAFKKKDIITIYKSENEILTGYSKLEFVDKNIVGKKGNDWEIINIKDFTIRNIGVFDDLEFNREVLFVTKNKFKGILNIEGETILSTEYNEISRFNYGSEIYLISKNGLKGLFDLKERKIILSVQFEKIEELACNNGIYVLTQKGQKILYDKYQKKFIKEKVQEIKCLDTKNFDSRPNIILLKIDNKQLVLQSNEGKWTTSDFFDKIEVLEGKYNNWEGVYDELIVYKNGQKMYLNIENYSIYKKPLLKKYEVVQVMPEIAVEAPREERKSNELEENRVYEEFQTFENARYEGGINSFRKEVQDNLVYPERAKVNKTEGNVVLQFTVNKKGNIEDIRILKDIGDGCGEAAVEAIKKTNKPWSPAKNAEGKFVKVRKVIPVTFKL